MSKSETISWIFLATAIAGEKRPADYDSISRVADGINHSLPTPTEMEMSLSWLVETGLLVKNDNIYRLTIVGQSIFEDAKNKTNTVIFNIWKELTKEIHKLQVN